MPNATITPAAGVGYVSSPFALTNIPRSLYLYENKTFWSTSVLSRSLYVYENGTLWAISVLSRSLYVYENRCIQALAVLVRGLYQYECPKDGEVFPWLNHIDPTEQYVGGQVNIYGDGFGGILEAQGSATITVSSTNGSNVKDFAVDKTASEWQSTSGSGAWIRFTWGAAKRIVGIVLEGSTNGTSWGYPRFRFDDATSQDGAVLVPAGSSQFRDSEYPVGTKRELYTLATPKVSTYVEIAVASGGSGTNRGFAEVWILEEAVPQENAETSRVWSNLGLPAEVDMGIVAWQNRSPNFWPANSGVAPLPAGTVTIPVGTESGLVYVREET